MADFSLSRIVKGMDEKPCRWKKINEMVFVMNGQNRNDVKVGSQVSIVLKKDQRTGNLTEGTVANLLTKSPFHPHGIKVRLEDGQVGRVKEIHED